MQPGQENDDVTTTDDDDNNVDDNNNNMLEDVSKKVVNNIKPKCEATHSGVGTVGACWTNNNCAICFYFCSCGWKYDRPPQTQSPFLHQTVTGGLTMTD